MGDAGAAPMDITDQGKHYFSTPAPPKCDPPKMPSSWRHTLDENSGFQYYYNTVTGESRWLTPCSFSVCRIPMRRPYYGKLFGIGICLFVLWFWCLLAVSFDDWITYTQQGRWSFNVGLYEACVQGTHACRMYISAGILYSFSLGFLLLSCLLLLVSDKIIKAESPNTPLFHFDNPNDDMNK